MRPAIALAVLLGLGATSCRALRGVTATPEDLAAYEPTRTLGRLEDRMRAAEVYLTDHPDGAFASDVRRSYLRADEALWSSKRGSIAGLQSYLAELPNGPHAKAARRELEARRRASVDLLGRGAARTEERLAAAAAARGRAREALGVWVRRFADPAVFGRPMSEAPSELVVAWSLGLPQPRCVSRSKGERACTKLVTETFEIPGDGERELVLELVVEESADGGVCGVTLRGPALFARWEEASSRAAIDLDVPRAREALLTNAASLVRSTHDTRPGATACSGETTGHGSYDQTFHCGPLRVDAVVGEGAGRDDALYFSTAYPCSSP